MAKISGEIDGQPFCSEKDMFKLLSSIRRSKRTVQKMNIGEREIFGWFSAKGNKFNFKDKKDFVAKINTLQFGKTINDWKLSVIEKKKKIKKKDIKTPPKAPSPKTSKTPYNKCSSCSYLYPDTMKTCPYCADKKIIEVPVIPSGYKKHPDCGHFILESIDDCVYCNDMDINENIKRNYISCPGCRNVTPVYERNCLWCLAPLCIGDRFEYIIENDKVKHFAVIVKDLRKLYQIEEIISDFDEDIRIYDEGEVNFGAIEAFAVIGEVGDEINYAIESESIPFYVDFDEKRRYVLSRSGSCIKESLKKWFSYKNSYKNRLKNEIRRVGSNGEGKN